MDTHSEARPPAFVIDWQETLLKTDLPANAKYIGMYLRTFMNAKSDIAWPSVRRIESETGLARSTVCKYLQVLESAGWIVRERGSKGVNTRYHACFPKTIEAIQGGSTDGLGGIGVVRETNHVVRETNHGGSTGEPRVVRETDTNNQYNKQDNNQVITKKECSPSGFDHFWDAYPRKTQKKNALKAWEKLKPDQTLLDLITENIKARVAAGDWVEKQFIPHPSTYLNQERWKDEVIGDAKLIKPPPDYSRMAREISDPFELPRENYGRLPER